MSDSCRDTSFLANSTAARLSARSASADATSWLRLPAFRSSRRASAEPRASRSLSTEKDGLAEVERDEEVSRLHAVSLANLHLDDAPGDLRRQVDRGGFDAAVEPDGRAVVALPAAGDEKRAGRRPRRGGG